MTITSIGVGLQGNLSPGQYKDIALTADELGIDYITMFGDLMFQPPIPPLVEMAGVTKSVILGPACLNPFATAPHEIAGQIAYLDLASKGRSYLGLARGTWLSGVGISQERAVLVLREALEVIRRLLAGDHTGWEGEIYRLAPGIGFEFTPQRSRIPTLIGTWGKQTAHLAGQVADEVKIGGTANPLMIPVMRAYLDEGACSVGRDPSEVGVVVGAVTVVDEDHEAARALARKEVAMYMAVVADLDSTIALDPDLVDQVRARVDAGDRAGAGVLIPDNVLDLFAFSGSPEHVAQQVQSLIDAGASRVELGTPQGINTGRGVRLIGERVLPLLRR